MNRLAILIAAAAVLAAGPATAAGLKDGDAVYIRVQETSLLKAPKGASLQKLKRGEKLLYRGQSPDAKQYHQVETARGKKGYVWYQDLSATAPKGELVIKNGAAKNVDAQAFASYGAAARGVTEGARKVSGRVDKDTMAKQFEVLEKVAVPYQKNPPAPSKPKPPVAAEGAP